MRRGVVRVELDRPEAVELWRRPICVATLDHRLVAGTDLDATRKIRVSRARGAHSTDLQARHLVHLIAHCRHPDVAGARLNHVLLPVCLDLDAARDHGRLARICDEAKAGVLRAEYDRRAEEVRAIAQHDGAAARGDGQICGLLDRVAAARGRDEDSIGRERARGSGLGRLSFHEWLSELAVALGVVEI